MRYVVMDHFAGDPFRAGATPYTLGQGCAAPTDQMPLPASGAPPAEEGAAPTPEAGGVSPLLLIGGVGAAGLAVLWATGVVKL